MPNTSTLEALRRNYEAAKAADRASPSKETKEAATATWLALYTAGMPTTADIRPEDLSDLTFEVAEQIAQFVLSEAEARSGNVHVHDALVEIAFKIRTGEWRAGWKRDPAKVDPRDFR